MITELSAEQIQTLTESAGFQKELKDADGIDEVLKVFANNGIEMTRDEWTHVIDRVRNNLEGGEAHAYGKLDEAELENVVGGIDVSWPRILKGLGLAIIILM